MKKQDFNKLCKSIEQLALDIKYLPIPKRKRDRVALTKVLEGIGSTVDGSIKTIKERADKK